MIKIVNGDLLKAKENIIGHQVNCQGVMGSGVALQVKKKYPRVFNMYKDLVSSYVVIEEDRKQLMGKTQFVSVGSDKWVANMFGQFNYGRDNKQYTKTDDLFNCTSLYDWMLQRRSGLERGRGTFKYCV